MKKLIILFFVVFTASVLSAEQSINRQHFQAGAKAQKAGNYKAAIEEYNKSLEEFPDDPGALSNRGQAKMSLNMYREAILDFTKAIEYFENYIEKDHSMAAQLLPGLAETHFARGIAEDNLGNTTNSYKNYTVAIKLSPCHAKAYFNRAVCNNAGNKTKAAIKDYDKAIECDPKYIKALFNRSGLRYDTGDYKGAIADLTRIIEIDPNNAEAYYRRGILNEGFPDKADAITDLFMASELGHPLALKEARKITGADK